MTPKVSFVTVNYKTPHFIRNLLTGIEGAKLSFSHEYIVVDNASGDETLEMVSKRFPWATPIASDTNVGFGAGNNLGINRAKGEYVILLNPDLTVFPGEIEAWVDWMDKHPDVGISGPRVLNPDGSDQDSCYRFPGSFIPFHRPRFLMHDVDRGAEQDVDWVLGVALCIRRSVLEKIGKFDEGLSAYFEDADLCRRAWEAGHRVTYTPTARFVHYHNHESRTRILDALNYFLKYRTKPNPRAT